MVNTILSFILLDTLLVFISINAKRPTTNKTSDKLIIVDIPEEDPFFVVNFLIIFC